MRNIDSKAICRILFGSVFAAMVLSACTEIVEKTDLGRVTDDVAWKNPKMVRGYFDNTVNAGMPGGEARLLGHSDECFKRESGTEVVYDNFNVNTDDGGGGGANIDRWPYETIRKINRFLDHAGHDGFVSLQPISEDLPQAEKEDMMGQLLVLRAYHYFDMVRTYGGVPLLLHEQDASSNFEDLYTPRAKTSACVAQIINDLDAAIALPDASFPMKRTDGHIGKGVAYALKGRVLLYYASPQFTKQTPAGTKTVDQRWNEAYSACKTAYDQLKAAGFELYAETGGNRQEVMDNYYKMLVTEEMNKEMIWVRRYEPLVQNFGWDKEFRPGSSSGATIAPLWEMACAFSNADGTPFTAVQIDKSKTGGFGDMVEGVVTSNNKPDGSAINHSVFWLNREPRFYAFIGYNGCEYPLIRTTQSDFASDVKDGKMQHEWMFYWGNTNNNFPFDIAYSGTSSNDRGKGLVIRKFVRNDRNYELPGVNALKECGTDWPLFRLAEVMLNLAEAAAKTNKPQEAYDMLDAIRKRAGIPSNNGYGLGRKTGDALILDILNERRIELFLESKRYYDVRRWRLYSDGLAGFKLNGTRRHALMAWLKDMTIGGNKSAMVEKLQGILDAGGIETQEGRDAYFDVFFHAVMLYDSDNIKYNPDRQDFMRIPYDVQIRKNPLIEQTMGWTDERGAGKFNPYE